MDGYIARFQDPGRTDKAEVAQAVKETGWVFSKEAKASAEAKIKAYVVIGLASRLQEKFDDTRKMPCKLPSKVRAEKLPGRPLDAARGSSHSSNFPIRSLITCPWP